MNDLTPNLIGSYDHRLVALSLPIAMLAAYAALDLAGRLAAVRLNQQVVELGPVSQAWEILCKEAKR